MISHLNALLAAGRRWEWKREQDAADFRRRVKRLLAIAESQPDLLAACEAALPLLTEYRERVIKGRINGDLLSGDYEPTAMLRAAIAKATGQPVPDMTQDDLEPPYPPFHPYWGKPRWSQINQPSPEPESGELR